MYKADLHLHSTASDGLFSPRELVNKAAALELDLISLTDHDTTQGLEEAIASGKTRAVQVIPGIEFSCEFQGEEVHILGYQFEQSCPELQRILSELKQARQNRILEITKRLQELGFKISWREVRTAATGASSVGRPHVARVMVEKGYARSRAEVFRRWLEPGCPGFIKRYKLSPAQAIDAVHGAGGFAFLAHPGLLKEGKGVAASLLTLGLDGIEVFHTEHSQEQTKEFLRFARENNLFISGGSDCHGDPEESKMGKIIVDTKLLHPWIKD